MEKTEPATLDAFINHLHYQAINTSDTADYSKLVTRLDQLSQQYDFEQRNTLFYLATPPSLYNVIPASLAAYGLNKEEDGWKRLIIEKPFGYDLESAQKLIKRSGHFEEHQIIVSTTIWKETVQTPGLSFSNAMFGALWNRNFIDYAEITGAEFLGVEERGGYYDGSGAVRDMFQNHLLQVLAMVGMEPPAQINADSMRDEVIKVLQCLKPLDEQALRSDLVLGQYTASDVRELHS